MSEIMKKKDITGVKLLHKCSICNASYPRIKFQKGATWKKLG